MRLETIGKERAIASGISRREFGGHLVKGAAVVALAGTTLELDGCNVFSDIETWIPVGIDAVNGILAVLSENGVVLPPQVSLTVGLIQAGLTALKGAIVEYQSTTPPPVGALQKIETIFQDIVNNFGMFLQGLNLPGGSLFTLIASLVQVILTTIAGFVNQLPTGTTTVSATLRVSATQTVPVLPVARSKRRFKKDYNSVLDGGAGLGVKVPAAAHLHLAWYEF
jgi:hypothetical protein